MLLLRKDWFVTQKWPQESLQICQPQQLPVAMKRKPVGLGKSIVFWGGKLHPLKRYNPRFIIPKPAKVSFKILLGKNCVNSKKIYIPMNILKEM